MQMNTSSSDPKTAIFVILGCSFTLVSFVSGLIIGLVVLGWWLWPVQWIDATPKDLRHEYQIMYVDMVVDSFEDSHDLNQARHRLDPWEETEALQLLDEAFDIAIAQGLVDRSESFQSLIGSYDIRP
jgi:hypothetical protein